MPHPSVEAEADESSQELQTLLDQELHSLPDLYRVPVVLCELEGRSRKEVARQLRVPEGTLSSRLATARKRLAERLRQRGVTLSGGALALVAAQSASARVPVSLVTSTVKAAMVVAAGRAATAGVISPKVAALMEGVSKAMWITKLKLVAVVLLVVVVATIGTGLFRHQALAEPQPEKRAEPARPAKPKEAIQRRQLTPAQYVESQTWALTEVDADKHTISLKLFRWIGEYAAGGKAFEALEESRRPLGIWKLQDYGVEKDVKVVIDGKAGEFKDLKPEMRVALRLAPGEAAIARIDATSPEDAILKSTDVEKNTITVSTGGEEVKFTLSPTAKISRNGYASYQFTDLKPGMRLDLKLGVEDGQIVVRELKAGH